MATSAPCVSCAGVYRAESAVVPVASELCMLVACCLLAIRSPSHHRYDPAQLDCPWVDPPLYTWRLPVLLIVPTPSSCPKSGLTCYSLLLHRRVWEAEVSGRRAWAILGTNTQILQETGSVK